MAQPKKTLIVFLIQSPASFIFPMSGNALLGNAMHLHGADLNLKRLTLWSNDRGMKRLIHIRSRNSYEVLYSSRNWSPQVMNDSQRAVTVSYSSGNDPNRHKIVHLLNGNLLSFDFLVNAIDSLDP